MILTYLLIGVVGKGKQVNIPVLMLYVRQRKFDFRHFGLGKHIMSGVLIKTNLRRIVMMRIRLNLRQVLFKYFIDAWIP